MSAGDAISEALAAPSSRPGRALLTALGTVLGVGLFVLTLGLTASTNAQNNKDFNALISTEVDVSAGPQVASTISRPEALTRAERLRGLQAIGPLLEPEGTVKITHYPARPSDVSTTGQISMLAASPGTLGVIAPTLIRGRLFNANQESRKAHVALIGGAAANILHMRDARLPWSVAIDGAPFLIEGVIGHTERHAEALLSVIIPYATARAMPGVFGREPPSLIAATTLGYTNAVAAALPAELYPQEPTLVTAAGLPEPTLLRQQINGNLTTLFVLLAGVGMIVGMVGITNSAVVSVMERISEIGVRRALGARKRQIALQFLLENLAIGTIGGILGVCLGVTALAAVTAAKQWTPILPLWVIVVAPITGSLTGLLAGVYPAIRAANADPVHALAR
ncbi:MAG: ABC transporter permease [Solirubrobacteraceae bacterium]